MTISMSNKVLVDTSALRIDSVPAPQLDYRWITISLGIWFQKAESYPLLPSPGDSKELSRECQVLFYFLKWPNSLLNL